MYYRHCGYCHTIEVTRGGLYKIFIGRCETLAGHLCDTLGWILIAKLLPLNQRLFCLLFNTFVTQLFDGSVG